MFFHSHDHLCTMSASPSAGLLLDPQLQAEMSSPPAQQDPKPPPPAPQYIFAGTTYETNVDKDAPAPPPASTLEFSGVVPTSLPVQAEQATSDANHGEAQPSEPQQGSVPPQPVVRCPTVGTTNIAHVQVARDS